MLKLRNFIQEGSWKMSTNHLRRISFNLIRLFVHTNLILLFIPHHHHHHPEERSQSGEPIIFCLYSTVSRVVCEINSKAFFMNSFATQISPRSDVGLHMCIVGKWFNSGNFFRVRFRCASDLWTLSARLQALSLCCVDEIVTDHRSNQESLVQLRDSRSQPFASGPKPEKLLRSGTTS